MNVTTRAVMTHLLPFFFLPHIHASTRTCLIFEGEGVGAIDCRVWHKRTFPGATDVRPTHSPTLRKWTSGHGVRHLATQNNEHKCTKCKNVL